MANFVPAGNVARKGRTKASHPTQMDFPFRRANVGPNVLAAKNRGQRAVTGTKINSTRLQGGAFG